MRYCFTHPRVFYSHFPWRPWLRSAMEPDFGVRWAPLGVRTPKLTPREQTASTSILFYAQLFGSFHNSLMSRPRPLSFSKPLPSLPGETAQSAAAGELEGLTSLAAVNVPDWELGPLPSGWDTNETPEGVKYWTDHNTKTTTWEDPRMPAPGDAAERDFQRKIVSPRGLLRSISLRLNSSPQPAQRVSPASAACPFVASGCSRMRISKS